MDININIRLDAPTGWKRRVLFYVATPIALIAAAAGVVWAGGLHTFQANEPLSASTMNGNFTQVEADIAAVQSQVTALGIPPGTVVAFPGPAANIPSGWVLCDGSPYNGTLPAYSALYAAIGTSNGGNASASEFNVPDYRGYFLRGLDTTGAIDPDAVSRTPTSTGGNAGAAVGSIESDAVVSHNHSAQDLGHQHEAQNGVFMCGGSTSPSSFSNTGVAPGTQFGSYIDGFATTAAASANISIGYFGGHETRSKNVAVNYIIKL